MPKQYACLAEVSATGSVSTIDFTSIPQTYTDLVLKVSMRDSRTANLNNLQVTLNGSSTGFSETLLYSSGSNVAFATTSSSMWNYVYTPSASATSSVFGNFEIYLPNYTASTSKAVCIDGGTENNAADSLTFINSAKWSGTAAVNRITINPDGAYTFPQYTTASLYGITKS